MFRYNFLSIIIGSNIFASQVLVWRQQAKNKKLQSFKMLNFRDNFYIFAKLRQKCNDIGFGDYDANKQIKSSHR